MDETDTLKHHPGDFQVKHGKPILQRESLAHVKKGEELLTAFRCLWDNNEPGLCKLWDILKYWVRLSPVVFFPQVRPQLRHLSLLGLNVHANAVAPSPVLLYTHNCTPNRKPPCQCCSRRGMSRTGRVFDHQFSVRGRVEVSCLLGLCKHTPTPLYSQSTATLAKCGFQD